MEAQKHLMPMTKEGEDNMGVWISGQIRDLPFGIKEYVFPKESLDIVLRTLGAKTTEIGGEYGVSFKRMVYPFLRKFLKLKPIPNYEDEGKHFKWVKAFVSIIVLGTREDGEIVGTYIDDLGWTHEAL